MPVPLLIAPLLVLFAGASRPFLPPTLEIEAYLDHAPKDVLVEDTITVRSADRVRSLVVVAARRAAGGLPVRLERGLLDYRLIGPRDAVERLLGGEPGARVHGLFAFYGAGKRLLILRLD
ncbi:MAG: hypothetical protein ACREQ9_17750 [Candidatus Binatia bacterium]